MDKYKKHYSLTHFHLDKSVRDGCNDCATMMKRAYDLGMRRFIPTDHASMASIYDVFEEAKKYDGMKAGIGTEFYMSMSSDSYDAKAYHITAMVANEEGYDNLLKLHYLANTKQDEFELDGLTGYYYKKPRINEQHIINFQEGLIFTSGCRLSACNNAFIEGDKMRAYSILHQFRENIKKFLIELHVANSEVEEMLFYELKTYAYLYNVPTLIANDAHYVNKSDLISWQLLNASRHKSNIFDTENQIKNYDFHIKSYEEIFEDALRCNSKAFEKDNVEMSQCELIEDTQELFKGHKIIDEIIDFKWQKNKIPMLHFDEAESVLKQELWNRLKAMKNKLISKTNLPFQTYVDRLAKEWDIAKQTNNISYFYMVMKFLDKCEEENIMLSMGRGSASSLLIGLLIKAHRVDPLMYGLIIERAMNTDRIKLMDIDLDFCSSESDRVIEILQELFGKDNVCAIINYGYNGVKQSVQTVCRYIRIPPTTADIITKEIDKDEEGIKVKGDEQIEVLKNNAIVKEMNINPHNGITGDKFIEYVKRIHNTINNVSIHASGILIMNEPIYNYVPVYRVGGILCSQFDMEVLEHINGLKLDVLKLSAMDIIKDGLNLIHKGE